MITPLKTGLASIAQGDPTGAPEDSAFFKVVNVVEFNAPLDWVWKCWPLKFDISKVMTDDPSGVRPTIGVVAQRYGASEDGKPFNEKGSHIFYETVGGKAETDELVLQRDHDKRVYEYVYSLGFAYAQGHMVYEATSPSTSKITWTYWIRPASDQMKTKAHEFMNKVWGPFIVNHACPNLKKAVDALYAGDESFAAPASTEEPVVAEETYRASIDEVWSAITDGKKMPKWFFETIADFRPEVGFQTRFNVHNEGVDYMHAWRVLEVVPNKRIVYRWRYDGIRGDSTVTFDLTRVPEGTKLTLTHRGHETFPRDNPVFSREAGVAGWSYFINDSLKRFLDSAS